MTQHRDIEIQVPGRLIARVRHGRIVGYIFIPAAADAGYFGEAMMVVSGEPEFGQDEFFDMVCDSLSFSEDHSVAYFSSEWQS
jgi:hypothetical protein